MVSRFPIGYGLDHDSYSNQFVLEDTLAGLENRLSSVYSSIGPGALYMDVNSSASTYAFVGDAGILPAMAMQNLLSQIQSGIPIVVSYAQFDGLVPVCSHTLTTKRLNTVNLREANSGK